MDRASSSGPVAARRLQTPAVFEPTNGTDSIQSGGGGKVSERSDCAQSTISSIWATKVPTATENGTMKTNSNARVITVTAKYRFPHSTAWARSINGQVATTIIVAQTSAGTNGRKIQNDAAMRPTMKSTES